MKTALCVYAFAVTFLVITACSTTSVPPPVEAGGIGWGKTKETTETTAADGSKTLVVKEATNIDIEAADNSEGNESEIDKDGAVTNSNEGSWEATSEEKQFLVSAGIVFIMIGCAMIGLRVFAKIGISYTWAWQFIGDGITMLLAMWIWNSWGMIGLIVAGFVRILVSGSVGQGSMFLDYKRKLETELDTYHAK